MASKMVTDRRKSAESVAAISEAQSGALADKLSEQFGFEQEFTLATFVDTLAQVLLRARTNMVDKDDAHQAELADDPKARDARDEATRDLAATLISLRDIVTGVYGQDTASRVFTEQTPSDAVALQGFTANVIRHFQEDKLGTPRIQGASFDAAASAQQLQQQVDALAERLQNVAREVRETEATLVTKNSAINAYDRTFTGIAKVFEGLFTLAGETELAARVRPSRRRPGQTAASTPDEPTTE